MAYDRGSFRLGSQVTVVVGEVVDWYTVDYLNEVLTDYGVKSVPTDAPS